MMPPAVPSANMWKLTKRGGQIRRRPWEIDKVARTASAARRRQPQARAQALVYLHSPLRQRQIFQHFNLTFFINPAIIEQTKQREQGFPATP